MQTASKAILALAVLTVAVFAGAVYAADDASAGTETSTGTVTVTYVVGDLTYTDSAKAVAGSTYTIKGLADLGISAGEGKTFIGWTVTGSATKYAAGTSYAIPADAEAVTFTADIDVETYKITFTNGDASLSYSYSYVDADTKEAVTGKQVGTEESAKLIPYGATITLPTIKTDADRKDGNVFLGWYVDGQLVLSKDTKTITVKGAASYVATYKADVVITFVVDGTQTYSHTVTNLVTPDSPAKEGYTFVGWSDGTSTVKADDLKDYVAKVEKNITLTAVFEPVNQTVTFTVDGVAVLTQTVRYGELAVKPAFVPAKEGYDFVQWVVQTKSTDAEGKEIVTETAYDFSKAVTSDLTIAAQFNATPEPEKTGLDNPVTLTVVIVICVIVGILIALVYLNRAKLSTKIVQRLDKGAEKK